MKVRDLIEQEIDIDVYDDVCEELGIAFCGPIFLTEAGEQEFAEVLDYPVRLSGDVAIICIDDEQDKVWKRRLRKAKKFFESWAGYCPADDWDRWFSFEKVQDPIEQDIAVYDKYRQERDKVERQKQKTINVLGDTQREQWKNIVNILRLTGGDLTYEGRCAICDELDRYIDHCEDILDGMRKKQEA